MNTAQQTLFIAIITALTSSGFMSFITFGIQRRDKKKEREEAKDSAEARMLLGLGHDRLIHLTDKFVRRGAITLKEKRNLKYLYEPYHEGLGGNGDCEIGYNESIKLPVVSEDEASEMDSRLFRKELNIETE